MTVNQLAASGVRGSQSKPWVSGQEADRRVRGWDLGHSLGLGHWSLGDGPCPLGLALMLLAGSAAVGQEWVDRLDDSLFLESKNGVARLDLSGQLDLEGYYIVQLPPGLIFSDDKFFFNPRLALFVDARLGQHLYSFVQVRFDRGFDPGLDPDGDARFDEYLLRYIPFDDSRVNFQLGKFATVVGNFVPRHQSWDNPFINAPLPYENVTTMTDQSAPAGPADLLARRGGPDKKDVWVPLLWGPSYATGASLFGMLGHFDYAFEFKNASISSRPAAWDARASEIGWDAPTIGARIGYRPHAAWNLGVSVSEGAYLLPIAEKSAAFPNGKDRGDYLQSTFGADARYEWRRFQLWSEVFASRFEVPNVGDADTLAWYLEAKYKLTSNFFAAGRWNQQFFAKVDDGLGGEQRWDDDAWRIDAALGWRVTRHLQAKVQYSYTHEQGRLQQGEQLVAGQLTLRF